MTPPSLPRLRGDGEGEATSHPSARAASTLHDGLSISRRCDRLRPSPAMTGEGSTNRINLPCPSRSHLRQTLPRRRRNLQGARRRGRRQARPRQGRARQDHRRLRRPRHPLRHQGHRQAAGAGDAAEGRRPRRHRRRQCRHSRRHRARRHRDEHAVRQFDHHRRARHRADVRARARRSPRADASTQAGKWEKNRFMGVEITGKTLGIIGCGNIGSIVAARGDRPQDARHRLRSVPQRGARRRRSASRRSNSTTLLARADFITLHTPMTAQTKNILSAENIAKTKKGVRIINCARGGLVDEAALRAALDSGHVAGAAFDVFSRGAGDGQSAVRPSQRRGDAASRRLDHRGAGERRAAGRRADVGLSDARRDLQRDQLSLDHRRGGAEAEAVHRARRGARLVRRPAHRRADRQGDDHLRGRGRRR